MEPIRRLFSFLSDPLNKRAVMYQKLTNFNLYTRTYVRYYCKHVVNIDAGGIE